MPVLPLPSVLPDNKACYAAFRARDARFDGRFFIGVSSTGVYCRPVCRARLPKEENCSYFSSAAAAETAGYRPCLKCRPELAPGLAPVDAAGRLARKAALVMEEDGLEAGSLPELAGLLGVTDRHLRRVFAAEYGVAPVHYLQTKKLLLAKGLLADTRLSVAEAALAAGFGSIRRFNELFRRRYGMTPSDLRKAGKSAAEEDGQTITLLLGYRPPYAWKPLLAFLAGRAIPGVENASGGIYRRTVSLRQGEKTIQGWLAVAHRPEKNALALTLSCGLLPVLPKVLSRVRALFDLDCNPLEIHETLKVMNEGSPGLCVPGTRLPGCFEPFEMAVRAVLGQQVTVKAARTLAGRFAAAFGQKLATPFAELNLAFPTPQDIGVLPGRPEDLAGPLGIIGARARSIFALAKALADGAIVFSRGADPQEQMKKLLGLPGFGPWTAQYMGMRVFGWPDAFPHTDYGVKKALPGLSEREILEASLAWRPWRAYAVLNLWNSLGNIHRSDAGDNA